MSAEQGGSSMKRLLVLVALLSMAATPTFAQGTVTGPFLVDHFSNNLNGGDQTVRLVNFGATGTPLTSPVGDVCANIYVFDNDQEMTACCSCRITPNGLLTLSVHSQLAVNPLTSVVSVNGDIKIVSTAATSSACSPVTFNGGLLDSTVGFATHLQVTAGATFVTETRIPAAALGSAEQAYLPQACLFVRYLGSGKGTCFCAPIT